MSLLFSDLSAPVSPQERPGMGCQPASPKRVSQHLSRSHGCLAAVLPQAPLAPSCRGIPGQDWDKSHGHHPSALRSLPLHRLGRGRSGLGTWGCQGVHMEPGGAVTCGDQG